MNALIRPSEPVPLGAGYSSRPERAPEVSVEFEALLWQTALAPLSRALGFCGDVVTGEAARTLARSVDAAAGFAERMP
jgi:hypothetical protein